MAMTALEWISAPATRQLLLAALARAERERAKLIRARVVNVKSLHEPMTL